VKKMQAAFDLLRNKWEVQAMNSWGEGEMSWMTISQTKDEEQEQEKAWIIMEEIHGLRSIGHPAAVLLKLPSPCESSSMQGRLHMGI
jgi:hypothetical protein